MSTDSDRRPDSGHRFHSLSRHRKQQTYFPESCPQDFSQIRECAPEKSATQTREQDFLQCLRSRTCPWRSGKRTRYNLQLVPLPISPPRLSCHPSHRNQGRRVRPHAVGAPRYAVGVLFCPASPRPAAPPCAAPTRTARGMFGFWTRQVLFPHSLLRASAETFRRRAGSGRTGCQQNYSTRKQRFTVPSKASKKCRFNVSPEARTSEILCKSTEEQNNRLSLPNPIKPKFSEIQSSLIYVLYHDVP